MATRSITPASSIWSARTGAISTSFRRAWRSSGSPRLSGFISIARTARSESGWRSEIRYELSTEGKAMRNNRSSAPSERDAVAVNGLLDRRLLLSAGAAAAALGGALPSKAGELPIEPWMKLPGSGFVGYGQPSKFESKVARTFASLPGTTGTGAARTPLHLLDGMITPNGVHFERSHSGIPAINPATKRPLIFTLESLERYPRESRVAFLECGGNGQLLYQKEPAPVGVQAIHGLVSCAEGTGVSFSVLLRGYEGNMNVKWLRRIKLTEGPTMTKDETSKYTIILPDGKSLQFVLPQEGKSVITQPSPGLTMKESGLYEISGLAWSGYGRITKVGVSADGA